MEDKNFLSYFHNLSSQELVTKKQAATKIVDTLTLTEALSSPSDYEHLDSKILEMIKKYLSGDLGDKLSADVNYTLKK